MVSYLLLLELCDGQVPYHDQVLAFAQFHHQSWYSCHRIVLCCELYRNLRISGFKETDATEGLTALKRHDALEALIVDLLKTVGKNRLIILDNAHWFAPSDCILVALVKLCGESLLLIGSMRALGVSWRPS